MDKAINNKTNVEWLKEGSRKKRTNRAHLVIEIKCEGCALYDG